MNPNLTLHFKKPFNVGEISPSDASGSSGNNYKKHGKRVAVAMSGGIDSSMAAKLLKDEGWEVTGVTMKLLPDDFDWNNNTKTCCSLKDIETARKVSLKLDIPHIIINFVRPFEKNVIDPFCLEYQKGNTPNPCVECNKYIKFGELLEKIKTLGASYLATGHHCRIEKSPYSGLFEVKKGVDKNKDQSYVLWKLNQEQLSLIKTPIGMFSKDHIKKEAERIFPFLKNKSESQDICFIPENNYHSFLASRLRNIEKGNILNTRGEIIGTHKGYPFYTVGQRKGLGISHSRPLYVKEIVPGKNIIIVGEEKDILQRSLRVKDINFIAGNPPGKNFRAMVKIRYNFKETPAEIRIEDKKTATILFDTPQKAITPGQSAVFYNNDILIGGGIIIKI